MKSPMASPCGFQPLDSTTHGKFPYNCVTMEEKDCMPWSTSVNWLIKMGVQNLPCLLGILIYVEIKLERGGQLV